MGLSENPVFNKSNFKQDNTLFSNYQTENQKSNYQMNSHKCTFNRMEE